MKKKKVDAVIELPGMPEPDEVGREANAYTAALEELDQIKDRVEKRANDLLEAMIRANRSYVRCNGRTITIQHVHEATKLKVKKG